MRTGRRSQRRTGRSLRRSEMISGWHGSGRLGSMKAKNCQKMMFGVSVMTAVRHAGHGRLIDNSSEESSSWMDDDRRLHPMTVPIIEELPDAVEDLHPPAPSPAQHVTPAPLEIMHVEINEEADAVAAEEDVEVAEAVAMVEAAEAADAADAADDAHGEHKRRRITKKQPDSKS